MENKTKKEEGFSDFIDGIEDVVTLTPSASSPFSETLSQPEPETQTDAEVDSDSVAPLDQNAEEDMVTEQEQEVKPEFNVRKLFFVCLGLFGVSSLGALFGHIEPIFGAAIYLWYIAAGVSLISVVVLFLVGVIKGVAGKSFEMVGYAVMFLVVLGVVGFGTCMLNMSGI